jgi:hypothetical protein
MQTSNTRSSCSLKPKALSNTATQSFPHFLPHEPSSRNHDADVEVRTKNPQASLSHSQLRHAVSQRETTRIFPPCSSPLPDPTRLLSSLLSIILHSSASSVSPLLHHSWWRFKRAIISIANVGSETRDLKLSTFFFRCA